MIAILLSTFNGEKYLEQQIKSLFAQTFKDFILYIKDDGSTDNTIGLIEAMQAQFPNIHFFKDAPTQMGAAWSFIWLLQNVTEEYYMFCDQDDVWFPNKIAISYDALRDVESQNSNKAILVHTDLIVTNSEMEILSDSLWASDKTDPLKITTKYLCLRNYVTGCTMLFNNNAKKVSLNFTKTIIMHDYWVAVSTEASGGIIITLPAKTVYYRQHEHNVIGASNKQYWFPRLQRYLHFPDIKLSLALYTIIKAKYNYNLLQYIWLRTNYYFTR